MWGVELSQLSLWPRGRDEGEGHTVLKMKTISGVHLKQRGTTDLPSFTRWQNTIKELYKCKCNQINALRVTTYVWLSRFGFPSLFYSTVLISYIAYLSSSLQSLTYAPILEQHPRTYHRGLQKDIEHLGVGISWTSHDAGWPWSDVGSGSKAEEQTDQAHVGHNKKSTTSPPPGQTKNKHQTNDPQHLAAIQSLTICCWQNQSNSIQFSFIWSVKTTSK